MNNYYAILILFYCCCNQSISSISSISSLSSVSTISSLNITTTNSTATIISTTSIANMNYHTVLRKLYQINTMNPVKMGLSNTLSLYNLIGRPLDTVPIIHVAGTNGKGSVALKTANCLQKSGIKTGSSSSSSSSSLIIILINIYF